MAYKLEKEPPVPSQTNFNFDASFPSFFAPFTAIGALLLSELLLSYSTKNPQDLLINLFIELLLFILVLTFLLGMVHLIFRTAVSSNPPLGEIYAVQFSRLTKATVAMALLTLLTGPAIAVYVVWPDAIRAWWFEW